MAEDKKKDIKQKDRLFKYIYNPLSLFGLALCGFGAGMILIFSLIEYLSGGGGTYLGIINFLILPPFFILGLILVPLGAVRYQKKRLANPDAPYFKLHLDLNIARHRKQFVIFLVLTFFVFIMVGTLSYQGFHYTESTEFCGSCHAVMDPQSTAHKLSSHARVGCVDCHVGEGAGWYVKSKMSGLYQVYATFANKYPRPIPTPVHNLRPARDTCENCHWPKFFIEDKILDRHYFLSDDENTEGLISLRLNIGGQPELGKPSGIHWHVINKVRFKATDDAQQEIPWVETTDENGETKVYFAEDSDPEELDATDVHTMDCIDCHNRPAHIYKAPTDLMNKLLASSKVDSSLPGIRLAGTEALADDYETKDEGREKIESYLREEVGDAIAPEQQASLESSIDSILTVYNNYFFPDMKARWDTHPNNIGHKFNLGCFRCHDGAHVAEDGAVITNDCTLCHKIIAQKKGEEFAEFDLDGLEFQHPEDIDEEWKYSFCNECHTGGE